MQTFDAKNTLLDDSIFAQAYRAVIPAMSDPKFVTIRIHPKRMAELQTVSGPTADVIEVGMFSEGSKSVARVIAVPVEVHPKDGAELVSDFNQDPTVVSFCINGIPHVQIINLAVTPAEAKAKAAADKDASDKADASNKAIKDAQLEKAKADAFEEGRKAALIEQARAAGAASVAKTPEPTKVQ